MICTLLLVPVSLLIFTCCNAGDPCPNKTKISPCTCTQKPMKLEANTLPSTTPVPRKKLDIDDNYATPEFTNDSSSITTIHCESLKTISDFEDKVAFAVNRKWIDKLVVSNIPPERGNTLARLPSNWLEYGRIRQLEIQNTQLMGDFLWKENSLRKQDQSLYWLKVNNCYLSGALTYDSVGTIQTRGLNYLRRLKGLDFSSNHLSAILMTAFKVPPMNLTTLILANNNIQHIDSISFNNILLLKYIDLSHNLLTSVERTQFAAPARLLEHIDLSWNSIQVLPVNMFDNMSALKWVDISNNFLYSLSVRPWSLIWKKLSFISVSGNFVECDCDLLWLLPILLPPNINGTGPKPLPGQTVVGQCVQPLSQPPDVNQLYQTINHDLISLTRDRITC